MTRKPCPDCKAAGKTKYASCKCRRPHPWGRCHTHHKDAVEAASVARHDAYVCDLYGLLPGEYQKLYEAQGGRCAVCQRARGIRRRLAVDHDHATGLVRGLLCSTCNKMLGHSRDSTSFFQRAIQYLVSPPAQRLLGRRVHKDNRGEQ